MNVNSFLQAIIADPASAPTTWAVLADWLEDRGDPRFEFVRLMHQPEYRRDLPPEQRDARVRELLAAGIQPVVPTIENSIGMRFVLIPAGTFWMGSPEGGFRHNECPQHRVEISCPFCLGAFPVTHQQYRHVMGKNPSCFCSSGNSKSLDTNAFPVESVSWDDAMSFCAKVSNLPAEKQAGRTYCLPTEAEWEYACRGGANSHSAFSFGYSLSSTQANFDARYEHDGGKGPYLGRPSTVGSYPANTFSLFDMHGNVWEWCSDWFDENYYQNTPERDPPGPESGEYRVLRGGCWGYYAKFCRSAFRNSYRPSNLNSSIGFRACFRLN